MSSKKILLLILLLSSLLRLWSLGSGDTLSDEVLYSFRAIGMLDFDEAADQTTPLEWFDPHVPSWTSLSFHDHPPLVFAVQHIFMSMFGETPFIFRLPSALLGIASVYLLYLIGAALYSKETGLFAAAFFAATVNHLVISRLGLQESYVIFFLLLSIYFFLKAERQKIYYTAVGTAVGLALLTKYTSGILIPIFLTHMLLFRRSDFSSRYLWLGTMCALLIFSPVLIYNYKLYRAVGHFDFQLSYLVGQNPDVWSIQPGKEEFPSLAARATAFFPNLLMFSSWMFLLIFVASILAFTVSIIKKIPLISHFFRLRRIRPLAEKGGLGGMSPQYTFLCIVFFWLIILIITVIGPSLRFLSMLTPFMALGIGAFFANTHLGVRLPAQAGFPISKLLMMGILAFEILYSINSQLILYPKGPKPWTWSRVHYENYHYGYEVLDDWIRAETNGRMPTLAFEPKYHFIGEIHKKALAQTEQKNLKPYPVLFVYDKNMQSIAQLWVLDRLQVYHAWPIITADTYVQFLNENGPTYFEDAGFTEMYYIFPTENVPWKKETNRTDIGIKLEEALTNNGIRIYTTLENRRSEPVFRIYRKEI